MAEEFENERPTNSSPSAQADQSFLRRWSRRKSQAQADDPRQADSQADSTGSGAQDADAESDASEAECVDPAAAEPTDADMPPLDSLGEGSDYRQFLSPRVSASLRRAALRKLFQSPRFNVRDGLDDYDGDYTRYTPLDDDTVTAHAKFHAARLREQWRADAADEDAGTSTAEQPAHGSEGDDAEGRDSDARGEADPSGSERDGSRATT